MSRNGMRHFSVFYMTHVGKNPNSVPKAVSTPDKLKLNSSGAGVCSL